MTENVGGVVGLSYDCQEAVPNTDLHLLATDPRLRSCGTRASDTSATWQLPDQLRVLQYPEEVVAALEDSFNQAQEPQLVSQLSNYREDLVLQKHGFDERMLLAVIDPKSEDKFRVAIVDKVLDEFYFEISLLEDCEVKQVCCTNSDNLAPISWAIEKKFMEKASLQNMSCSPLSKIAPKSLFRKMRKCIPSLEIGQKLEYCKSFHEKVYYLCEVVGKQENILTLDIWTETGKETKLVSGLNTKLFPAGFAEINHLDFFIPDEMKSFATEVDTPDTEKTEVAPTPENNHIKSPFPSLLKSSSLVNDNSSWCPRIYINHLCYSASFVSKSKLASLPGFIGSGPVRLVMREVLSRLIAASFKSGAVLKKLEIGEDRKRRPDYWLETMKGKSRVLYLQADIEIPSKASQVSGFCREVCQKLSCCPYLFGPQLVGAECPSACNSRPKSDFQAEGEAGPRVARRGRRGRKRQKVANTGDKEADVAAGGERDGGESSGESGSSSPSCSTTVTTNTTRDNSPEPGAGPEHGGSGRRRYGPKNWGDILPPSEIKTRGAKLPSFAIQLKVRPSKKDVEELEKLIAAKCEPDSPPRPPSPKLLRSKAGATPTERRSNGHHPSSDAAFSADDIPDTEPVADSPRVWQVSLASNPVTWSPAEVAAYLGGKAEVAHLADKFRDEEVDGEAFLLLNLPTLLEHWSLKMTEAITLSRHIESVKLAFFKQYAFVDCIYSGSGRGG